MTDNLYQHMERALALAERASLRDEVPVGAILLTPDNQIIEGWNQREETSRTTAHAEIIALEEYSRLTHEWRLPPGSSLFVTAEPCLMCTGALLWGRVDNVYYGCRDTKDAGLERIRPLIENGIYDHRFSLIEGGILGDRCSGILTKYFRAKRESRKTLSSP